MNRLVLARIKPLPLCVAIAVLAIAVAIGAALAPRNTAPAKLPGVQALPMPRPAGAVCRPEHEAIFVVDRQGEIGEFDLTGRRRQLASFNSAHDLEGVSLDPRTGWLYVVDGGEPLIYEIDMDREPAEVRRTFEVPMKDVLLAASRDAVVPGKGLTGICFLPPQGSEQSGHFILTHGDDALGLIEVELPLREREGIPATGNERVPAQFVNRYDLGTGDLSDVTYDAATRSLLVLSARRRELLFVSLDGHILGFRKFDRVGMNGLALLPDRRLFITLARGGLQWLSPEQWGDTLPSSARIASSVRPSDASRPPKPYYETMPRSIRSITDDLFPRLHERSDWRRFIPNGWILFGFGGQFLFFARFIVQWYVSEKRKRVTVPVAFWYISIVASLTIFIYAIHRRDIVFIAATAPQCAIYIRNLMLLYQHGDELPAVAGAAPATASAATAAPIAGPEVEDGLAAEVSHD